MRRVQLNLAEVTALFGLATVVLGLIIVLILPTSADLTNGFRTPIIAFEFAQSGNDLAFLAADDEIQDKFDQAHRWDMVFPVAYGLFLALLLIQSARANFKWLILFVPLALLAIPFDIWENMILIEITELLRNDNSAVHLLNRLQIATWLKWGMIGIGAGAVGVGEWRNGSYWSATIGVSTFGITAVCWLSDSDPRCVELMALLVFIFFLWFFAKQCVQIWRSRQD